jgi:hypothetical protein
MKRRGGKGQAFPSLMHMLQKVEGEVKAGSLTTSKIENPAIEKANGSQEEDLSQERVLSAIIVTSLGICKKITESIKEIKKGRDEDKNEENGTAAVVFDGDVAIVCDDSCVNLACQDTTWVADSATSYHITP